MEVEVEGAEIDLLQSWCRFLLVRLDVARTLPKRRWLRGLRKSVFDWRHEHWKRDWTSQQVLVKAVVLVDDLVAGECPAQQSECPRRDRVGWRSLDSWRTARVSTSKTREWDELIDGED